MIVTRNTLARSREIAEMAVDLELRKLMRDDFTHYPLNENPTEEARKLGQVLLSYLNWLELHHDFPCSASDMGHTSPEKLLRDLQAVCKRHRISLGGGCLECEGASVSGALNLDGILVNQLMCEAHERG